MQFLMIFYMSLFFSGQLILVSSVNAETPDSSRCKYLYFKDAGQIILEHNDNVAFWLVSLRGYTGVCSVIRFEHCRNDDSRTLHVLHAVLWVAWMSYSSG